MKRLNSEPLNRNSWEILGEDHQSTQNSGSSLLGFNTFPGPHHPDCIPILHRSRTTVTPMELPISGSTSNTECQPIQRLSLPPPCPVISRIQSHTQRVTSANHSCASSVGFPPNTHSSSFNYQRGATSALWHPPMLAPEMMPYAPVAQCM